MAISNAAFPSSYNQGSTLIGGPAGGPVPGSAAALPPAMPTPAPSRPVVQETIDPSARRVDAPTLLAGAISFVMGGAALATGIAYLARQRPKPSMYFTSPQSARTYTTAMTRMLAKEGMIECNPAHQAPPVDPFDRSRPWYHERLNGPHCAMHSLNMLFNGEPSLLFGTTDFKAAAYQLQATLASEKLAYAWGSANHVILPPEAFVAFYHERLKLLEQYLKDKPLPSYLDGVEPAGKHEFRRRLDESIPHVKRFLAEKPHLMHAAYDIAPTGTVDARGRRIARFDTATRAELDKMLAGCEQIAFRRPVHRGDSSIVHGFSHHYGTLAYGRADEDDAAGWRLIDSVHENPLLIAKGENNGATARRAIEHMMSTHGAFKGGAAQRIDLFIPTKKPPQKSAPPFMRDTMRLLLAR